MKELEETMPKMMSVIMITAIGMSIIETLVPKEEAPPGGLTLQIISVTSPLAAAVSPLGVVGLYEEETYIARVSITNLSTRAGEPVAANLWHWIGLGIAGTILIDSGRVYVDYGPNETKTFDYEFTVPVGAAASTATSDAYVGLYDPTDRLLAYVDVTFNIFENPILITIDRLFGKPEGAIEWTELTGAEAVEWNINLGLAVQFTNNSRYLVHIRPTIVVTDPQAGIGSPVGTGTPTLEVGGSAQWEYAQILTQYGGVYIVTVTVDARKSEVVDWETVATRQFQFLVSPAVEYGGGIQIVF